jgi:hypothetical protein
MHATGSVEAWREPAGTLPRHDDPPYVGAATAASNPRQKMDLKITGTIRQVLAEASGESRNGPWRKQEFILETEGNYPKPVCIAVWGDNIDQFALREGERVTASIDIQSREYNGRWYTDVKAWKVERDSGAGGPPPIHGEEPMLEPPGEDDDDLPF